MAYPKLSDRLKQQNAYVEERLGTSQICDRCGATLETYADDCSAELDDACPGFMTVENAIKEFNAR